jgi:membrane protease YdiL (CAAX protease family)
MKETLWRRTKSLRSAGMILTFYLGATLIAHTLLYTIVAYLVAAADKTGTDFGNTVNEIAGQYYLFSFALAALLMMITTWKGDRALYRHDPFWNSPHKPAWQLDRHTKEELLRGISSGVIAAVVYFFLFTVSGQGGFLGVYITSTFGTPVFPLFFLDLISLCVLVFCEEYVFRHKILRLLLIRLGPGTAIAITAAAYLLVKNLQFELTGFDLLNLGLLNLALGYFFLKSGKPHRGIGFALLLLTALHTIGGLPLWGQESPSFFLFKSTHRSHEILFGGGLGPFSGLALSSILFVFALGSAFSWKRATNTRQPPPRIPGL